MPFRLLLPRHIYEEMIDQAKAELPNECCGLLAGRTEAEGIARVLRRYALVNALASPTRYESEAHGLLHAHVDARRNATEFLAVYHSHPTSPPIPSRTDLAANYWEGVIHFIISLEKEPADMQGWWLGAENYQQAEWVIVDG
jgi:proteasome lid subunit RPN8/RPN11